VEKQAMVRIEAVLRAAVTEKAFNFARAEQYLGSKFVRRGPVFEVARPYPFLSVHYAPPPHEGEPTFPGGELTFMLDKPTAVNLTAIGLPVTKEHLEQGPIVTLTEWLKKYSLTLEDKNLKEISVSYMALE
jgi:hypothetical protein